MASAMSTSTDSQPVRKPPLARGLPLGRYAGVEVVAHWSTVIIVLLLSVVLGAQVLPAWQPHRSAVVYGAVAAATAIGFIVTLLAHELAHAAAARHYRVSVRRITLWLFGGMTELADDAPTPRAAAIIAAAGPLTSLGIGAALLAPAAAAGHGLAAAALGWLAGASLLLGVFNLLPGIPLDGGRVLQAVLWTHWRDRRKAIRVAANVGRALGLVVVALGVAETFTAAAASGVWLALIGWFLAASAAAAPDADLIQALPGATVRTVMTTPPATVPAWWSVADFLTHLDPARSDQRRYVLVDFDSHPIGTLALPALRRVPDAERGSIRLRDLGYAAPALVVAPDTPLEQVLRALRSHGIATVVDEGRPVGTVTLRDIETRLAASHAARDADATPAQRQPGEARQP